jgi:thiosulfate/3-mercaptopyruvate sulfurtransferase
VPFVVTVDPESQQFVDDDTLTQIFDSVGALNKDQVICYCGGGIAACNTALTLNRLGVDKVSVYDGSMTEWAGDPSLPLETD